MPPPFTLSRATPASLQEIVESMYACFPAAEREVFMGCRTPSHLPLLRALYAENMRTDPHDVWMQVRHDETGKLVAASNWKVYVNGEDVRESGEEVPEWLEDGEARAKSFALLEDQRVGRRKGTGGKAFVYLHILFTNAEYRRMGAGGLMMQWGVDLMDLLSLPGWVEASEQGNFLYKRFGFVDFEGIDVMGMRGMRMKRDVKGKGSGMSS